MKTLIQTFTFILWCGIGSFSCSEQKQHTTKSDDESEGSIPNSVVVKLDRIVVPRVDMVDATVEEALEFARFSSFRHDPDRDTAFRGVSFIQRQSRSDQIEEPDGYRSIGIDPSTQTKRVTYAAENIRLLELVGEIARQASLDSYLTSVGIVFVPEGSDPFPNAKADNGDVWKVLRQSQSTNKED